MNKHKALDCEEVIRRLFEYLDRELDDQTRADIDRHLQHCRGCFSRAEFERRLRVRIAAAGEVKAPERLRRRIDKLLDDY